MNERERNLPPSQEEQNRETNKSFIELSTLVNLVFDTEET